VVNKVSDIWRN